VTPTIAGGVAATVPVDEDADEDALVVTVTVGDGAGLLFPHADNAATIAATIESATPADLYLAASISGSP